MNCGVRLKSPELLYVKGDSFILNGMLTAWISINEKTQIK